MKRESKEGNSSAKKQVRTTPIAIIGIGSIFPKAHNTQEYWDNILSKIDCVSDVPVSRWDISDYYDPDPTAPDKTYCKRGGFIPDVDFDPMEFGLPPNILEVTDVSQLLSLVVARDALEDAGYGEEREYNRENVGVVLGVVGMSSKIFTPLMNRLQYPVWDKVLASAGIVPDDRQKIIEKMKLAYIGWEENAFPGAIGNVIAGRICNRFDLGGVNCVVDAACASSLAAIKMAVGELIEGRADMMITGGVDTDNSINTYMCFSKTPAFSKSDRVRTFDAQSDGMMVGEGLGMVVMKRLEDAERDGDRVYAVVQAIGTSSDGRFKSIYAPRPAGQARALRRAYDEAGFSPQSVGLIEAHGTGTMAGDPSEFQGLCEVFGEENPKTQYIALGSVKSQIAHTKAAAGVASLIKTSLALYHKILPPTINVTQPNPKFKIEQTPFYINTETRPWIRAGGAAPRRAGVSSFGFGGTNYHVVLQEYQNDHEGPYRVNRSARMILLDAPTPQQLLARCKAELDHLQAEGGQQHFAQWVNESKSLAPAQGHARLGFLAETVEEAVQALAISIEKLSSQAQDAAWDHPKAIYFRSQGIEHTGKVTALFAGQGSQYLEMGRELALNFPPVRHAFGLMDELFLQDGLSPLSERVYPRPVFDSKERERLSETLQKTEHAQPAIGVLSAGLYNLLVQAGLQVDYTAGHSFGELTALWAGGVLNDRDYFVLAKARGKAMAPPDQADFDAGTMLAVKGDIDQVKALFANNPEVVLANWNSNNQVVIAGSKTAMTQARQQLEARGFQAIPLPVSAAFHTPLVGHAHKPFAEALKEVTFNKPQKKVYANGSGKRHSDDPQAVREALAQHILNPVLFRDEIQNIYADGGRIFIEFGPKNILTNLVGNILEGQPHLAVALNSNPKKDSDRQLREAVLQLRVAGIPLVNFDPYEKPLSVKAPRKKSPVAVTLNAGYYITEKTRNAFQNALVDGFKVSQAAATPAPHQFEPQPVQPQEIQVIENPQPMESALMSSNDLQGIEQLLADYQSHQSETVRLHEQYLRTEEEYARAFAHLTQLQTELIAKASAGTDGLQAVLPLFESLERSILRFHDHQDETNHIHQRYLESQERFAQTLANLAPTNGSGSAPITMPARPVRERPAPAAAAQTAVTYAPPAVVKLSGNGNGQVYPAAPQSAASQPVKEAVVPVQPVQQAAALAVKAELPAKETPAAATAPAASGVTVKDLTLALLEIVSEKTGYPVETLELDMDMEADLGIDSIKRVEILGGMQTKFPELPKVDATVLAELRTLGQIIEKMGESGAAAPTPAAEPPAPVKASQAQPTAQPMAAVVDREQVTQALLAVVSEKTGYPVETLELDMDMEADLGIDSIKRVEILGAMQTQFPELPKPEPSALAELQTLRQIIQFLSAAGAAPETAASPAVGTEAGGRPFDPGVEQGFVFRKLLPPPDSLQFKFLEGTSCLVTDDGTQAAVDLANLLVERGWPVAVLRFPQSLIPVRLAMPDKVMVFDLDLLSEENLTSLLDRVKQQVGPVSTFIHIAPASKDPGSGPLVFSDDEMSLLKMIFLTAKHLKNDLNQAAEKGRGAFVTVSRLDGEFGLSQGADYRPVSGGLFGLVKTLNLEWENVFCRAIDIAPGIDLTQAARIIVAELHDPNRLLTEVAYNQRMERSTLALRNAAHSLVETQ